MAMLSSSPNPRQSNRSRSNPGLVAAPFCETGLTTIDEGTVASLSSSSSPNAIGQGASSIPDRSCSGQSPATASHYRTPDHKILFSKPSSSTFSITLNPHTETITLSSTTLSMLATPSSSSSSSSTVPAFPSSSASSTTSSVSSALISKPSYCSSMTSDSSISSSPPFAQHYNSAREEGLDFQHKNKDQQRSSQAENNTSPDQEQQLLQSQHQQLHLQLVQEKQKQSSPPQEPSFPSLHSDRADCQSHLSRSSSSSPQPRPILARRSPVPPPPVILPSISCSINSPSSSPSSSSTSPSTSPTSSLSPPLSCSVYSYRSNPSPSPLSPSTATDTDPLLPYTLPSSSAFPPLCISSLIAPRIITSSPIAITSSLQLPRLEQQQPQSALSPSLNSLPFCGSPSSSGIFSAIFTAESTTSTSLSCAYSQPFLSVPSSSSYSLDIASPRSATTPRLRTSTSLLQSLDSLSPQPSSLNIMTRQRSKSASSAQQFSKSPRSPTASLATTTDLFDPQQPPKTLQDILLLAQSHYISHRYVQAMSLYKLAAEHHHSLPACSSLYALYTSTQTGSGLVRSDTKAALILIHALRIWTARRWSISAATSNGGSSVRSRTQDDYDELEEYFAHRRKPTRPHKQQQQQQRRSLSTGATVTLHRTTKEQLVVPSNNKNAIAQSMESEYRHPQFLNWRDDEAAAEIHKESEGSEGESNSSDDNENDSEEDCDSNSDSEGDESDLNTDQDDSDDNINNSDDEDEDDEEQEKEEEARRLGLATSEIEDIIQKICHMIQKGVLGLDEPVLVEAISMLRKIERGLQQEAEALKAERARSVSLFTSSLSGGPSEDSSATVRPALLLTHGIDLSFLDLDNNNKSESSPLVQALPVGRSIRQQPGRNFTSPIPLTTSHELSSSLVSPSLLSHDTPKNASIAKLSTKEQDTDLLFACAIRIRVMFTLGWVHQQKGEYHYGAQAYGVCSEISSTGKRLLDSLQHQANVQRWTCKAFEHKALEQAEAGRRRRTEDEEVEADVGERRFGELDASGGALATPTRIEGKKSNSSPATQSPPSRNTIGSSASSVFTSSQPSTAGSHRHHQHHNGNHHNHRPDISSPSSLSSSESDSASTSVHYQSASVSAVSSFSAAIWSSGLFKSAGSSKSASSSVTLPPQTGSKVLPQAGLKIRTMLEPSALVESKDKRDRHHQRGRSTKPGHHQGSTTQALPTLLTMTMTGHQNQITKCGHCGQKRALMPLCKCKKVRYCGLECRLAHLETHRSTCSSSGLFSPGGVGGAMGAGVDPFSVAPSLAGVAL
ncbi:MAG: hypothetical protein J3R72DRAFT_86518 [Linnemannia gamsii]|nr:MAG: hypothetical protein J3R72DRAFT_86518 [Linnemannia gamsii]